MFRVKLRPAAALLVISFIAVGFFACTEKNEAEPLPVVESATPSGEVMMQTFYWDVPAGGTWYGGLESKLSSWQAAGITALWLPVISKGQSGPLSMGYDPYDYFDFGQYDQHGTVETRFGSATELTSLLSNAKAQGFKLIADIVLNHNSGGNSQFNPQTNSNTWTLFNPASGKFNRTYADFHPNTAHAADAAVFASFPDLCHDVQNVKDWLWLRPDGVGKYYKNTLGFDGWRFDFVTGYAPTVVKEWNAAVGGSISIGEKNWDSSIKDLNDWCTAANSGAFDFPLYFALDAAFDGDNMVTLGDKGLITVNSAGAYTFVANHDTDEISAANKLKAYAYILTAEGTPFIFYKDYEMLLDKAKLNTLIEIKKTLAAGSTTKLFAGKSQYIFRRNGTPGLVAFFNNGAAVSERRVQTQWANALLKDFTGTNPDVTTDESGYATLTCQANNYAVYSRK